MLGSGLGRVHKLLFSKKKKHCKKIIIDIIDHVCVFVLIVLSNYVDKYINKKVYFLSLVPEQNGFLLPEGTPEGLGVLGCGGFQGKGVEREWGGGFRPEGGIGVRRGAGQRARGR